LDRGARESAGGRRPTDVGVGARWVAEEETGWRSSLITYRAIVGAVKTKSNFKLSIPKLIL
jgi:hypothetical protein